MPEPGKLSGRYNLVVADEFDLFEHQVPVEEFVEMLREGDIPDEICVVGLGRAFTDETLLDELSRLMDRRADDFESRQDLPTIQFAVENGFQRRHRDYELEYEGDLYRLSRLFGRQLDHHRDSSNWLIAPF